MEFGYCHWLTHFFFGMSMFFCEESWVLITYDRSIFTLYAHSLMSIHKPLPYISLFLVQLPYFFFPVHWLHDFLFHVGFEQHFSWLPISFTLRTLCFIHHFHHFPFQGPLDGDGSWGHLNSVVGIPLLFLGSIIAMDINELRSMSRIIASGTRDTVAYLNLILKNNHFNFLFLSYTKS